MPSVDPTIVGEESAQVVFARSNDPIKKLPEVNFDSGQDLTVAGWLEAAFYPFISATMSISTVGLGLQEFGASGTNLKTVGGELVAWDETVFTSSSFKLSKDGGVIETFANPTGNTSWSKVNVDVQPATASGRSTVFKVEVEVGDNGATKDLDEELTVNFAPPTFHALGATHMTVAEVKAAGDSHVVASNNSTHAYTNPLNKFIHIAVPVEYAATDGFDSVKVGLYEYWDVAVGTTRGLDYVKADRTLSTAPVVQALQLDNGQWVDYHVYSWAIVWSTNTAPTVVFT